MKCLLVLILFINVSLYSQQQRADSPLSQPSPIENEILIQAQKFQYILQTAYKNHKDSIDIKKISEAGLNAMLTQLDPYSNYFSAEQYKTMIETYKGSTIGIGISTILLNDTIVVVTVLPGSSADSAGIITGDKILFVDGQNVVKTSAAEVNNKLSGLSGTYSSIIIRRGNTTALNEYRLEKKELPVYSITTHFIIPGTKIGYIKSLKFSENANKEFLEATRDLKSQGMKNLLIDVRGNPGGYLEQVVEMIDDFVAGGSKISYTKSRNPEFYREYVSKDGGDFEKIPIIVLIDAQAASGSEVLAGAVQDLDRGLVVGDISFGKGTVQKFWEFKDGSAFKLTIASYYTPAGRSIQKPYNQESPALDPSIKMMGNENTQKQIEETFKMTGGKNKLPVVYSSGGRALIGGGGIFPDYFAKDDTTTKLTQVLKNYGIFLEFAFRYLNANRQEITSKYGSNFLNFAKDFIVNDNMLNELMNLSKSKNIWNDQMFQIDKEFIRGYVKAYISFSIWGDPGYHSVMMEFDKPFKKAIELFPEAEKMLNK